jgi:hypothetical protein
MELHISISMLYFTFLISVLVEETNTYYHQYFSILVSGPSSWLDITETEMFMLIIVQMEHYVLDSLAYH